MTKTTIIPKTVHNCTLLHPFQDQKYNGGRIVNKRDKEMNKGRCTVCGNDVIMRG